MTPPASVRSGKPAAPSAGIAAYAFLVVVLRSSGKRTLSKLNAFELIITVAPGSTLATIVLSKDVALAEASAVVMQTDGSLSVILQTGGQGPLDVLRHVKTGPHSRAGAARHACGGTPIAGGMHVESFLTR